MKGRAAARGGAPGGGEQGRPADAEDGDGPPQRGAEGGRKGAAGRDREERVRELGRRVGRSMAGRRTTGKGARRGRLEGNRERERRRAGRGERQARPERAELKEVGVDGESTRGCG